MRSKLSNLLDLKALIAVVVLVLVCTTVLPASKDTAANAAAKQFATPEEASDALIKAAEAFDVTALLEILGPDGHELVSSQDPTQDKNRAIAFSALAREKKLVQIDRSNPNRAILLVGNDDWPLPIPIVKLSGKWSFDAKAGRTEILLRRIGANELNVIEVCHGLVEAQRQYASESHDNSGIHQYAQRLISTPGKQDGLYWVNADGTPGGPVSEGVAKAIEQGYSLGKETAYNGYYFRLLKGQGPAAPGGEIDYVIKGVMIGGFAMVAVPAEYRVTGVQTFMVSNDGIVYQRDLGPDSINIVKKMERYNPDKAWQATNDSWETAGIRPTD